MVASGIRKQNKYKLCSYGEMLVSITPNLFADHVINIAVTGALVRIELGVQQAPAAEGQKPQLVPSQTLVMPLDGFVNSFGMFESIMKKLIETGVVAKQAKPAAASLS
jgi:hypothetical protein